MNHFCDVAKHLIKPGGDGHFLFYASVLFVVTKTAIIGWGEGGYERDRTQRVWDNGGGGTWGGADAILLYSCSWILSTRLTKHEAKPYNRCVTNCLLLEEVAVVPRKRLDMSTMTGLESCRRRTLDGTFWGRTYQGFARKSRLQGETRRICVHVFYLSGAEKKLHERRILCRSLWMKRTWSWTLVLGRSLSPRLSCFCRCIERL